MDQPVGVNTLDSDSAALAAEVGASVANRVGAENFKREGGGVKESEHSERERSERNAGEKNKSKSKSKQLRRLRSCMKYSAHNTCVRRSVCTDDNGRVTDKNRLARHGNFVPNSPIFFGRLRRVT